MTQAGEPLQLTTSPVVSTGMLIRRPVAEVFEAFVDPALTTHFWFTHGSGRLAPGARVRWEWAMYGVGDEVEVLEFEPERRYLLAWGSSPGPTSEWRFEPRAEGTTFVTIEVRGLTGSGDERVAYALDQINGFSLVLAGAKAWLEHGIELGLVPDRHPDAHVAAGGGR